MLEEGPRSDPAMLGVRDIALALLCGPRADGGGHAELATLWRSFVPRATLKTPAWARQGLQLARSSAAHSAPVSHAATSWM